MALEVTITFTRLVQTDLALGHCSHILLQVRKLIDKLTKLFRMLGCGELFVRRFLLKAQVLNLHFQPSDLMPVVIQITVMLKLHLINFKLVLAQSLLNLQNVFRFLRDDILIVILRNAVEGTSRPFIKGLHC